MVCQVMGKDRLKCFASVYVFGGRRCCASGGGKPHPYGLRGGGIFSGSCLGGAILFDPFFLSPSIHFFLSPSIHFSLNPSILAWGEALLRLRWGQAPPVRIAGGGFFQAHALEGPFYLILFSFLPQSIFSFLLQSFFPSILQSLLGGRRCCASGGGKPRPYRLRGGGDFFRLMPWRGHFI